MARPKKKQVPKEEAEALIETIIEGIREKKGKDIVCLDLRELNHRVSDYFVICHADNTRQVVAIADSVEDFTTRNLNEKPWHVEGLQNANWVLMDYINVVVHVFHTEARDFYGIEKLWADARTIQYES